MSKVYFLTGSRGGVGCSRPRIGRVVKETPVGDGVVVDASLTLPLLVIVLAARIGPIVIVALQVDRIPTVLWVALLVLTVLAGPFGIVPAGAAWLLGRARREAPQPDDDALATTAAIRRVPPRRRG